MKGASYGFFYRLLWELHGYRKIEFWFGLQAVGTSIFSYFLSDPTVEIKIVLFFVSFFSFPQVYYAWIGYLPGRHWSNIISFLLNLVLCSLFMLDGFQSGSFDIATFGYLFLCVPVLVSVRVTHLLLEQKR